ncbi:helix-turn-helix domain-containing protein [Rhizobium sp. CC-YZS058]|uniref:helix-turn-helix domain-containing protein n=1 Tax=Rhizobium sp. CC-YZS058 TaxID=3042153 RepID=UPI002B05DC6C|nr:helix-turn-helix domain-containing protein [Rhizobium sp. CC-YZS058]MEA3535569.1 helix-turn-helix domain-containing protein [Rhizobium sp. CC-YZS058]
MSLSRAFSTLPLGASTGAAPLLGRMTGQTLPPTVVHGGPPGGEPFAALWSCALPAQARCSAVRQITAEMVMLVEDRMVFRRDRRRATTHVRQIAMYVCHVALQLSLTEIGQAFGRDRTTVGHACNVVEDRRDDPRFDDFVSAVERVVTAVFGAGIGGDHA